MQSIRTDDARLILLKHLGNPVRLGTLDWLAERGPSAVSELATHLGTSTSQLSNHLHRLREGGLVEVERTGRQVVYRLANEQVIELLSALATTVGYEPGHVPQHSRFALARTCFDHLAGRLGVSLFDRLTEMNAIRPMKGTAVELGSQADHVLTRIGVDPRSVHAGRRQFACTCPDATERRPHLGGALGAALAEALTATGWITVRRERREVDLTVAGRRGLRTALELEIDNLSAV